MSSDEWKTALRRKYESYMRIVDISPQRRKLCLLSRATANCTQKNEGVNPRFYGGVRVLEFEHAFNLSTTSFVSSSLIFSILSSTPKFR